MIPVVHDCGHGAAIRATLEASPGLAACGSASLTGTITVRFDLGSDGVVTTARVERDDVGDPLVAGCIVDAVLALSFDPVEVPHAIRYPVALGVTPAEGR